jgi:ankyrin repeat protein
VPEGTSASEVREATSLVFTEAAQNGFVDVCRVMLEKQVVKDQGILRGALLAAADNSDLCRSEQVLALLLEAGADANAGLRHFDAFNTPLGKAVFHQNIKAAQLLLKHGASVRCTSSGWGTSALEYAASWCERPDMVRLLIKHGARQGREAAIKKAASEGKWDVVQVLMDLSP